MKIREMLDQLDEISRRDFLKGVGATAGLVALGAPQKAFGQETVGSFGPYIDIGKVKIKSRPNANDYYPEFSRRAGEQGQVVVRIYVNSQGIVNDVRLLQSSSYPRLDRAAMEIGKRFVFDPFEVNGKPTAFYTNILLTFRLGPTSSTQPELDSVDATSVAGTSPGYANKIRQKIKPLIVFNASATEGNPAVVVLVDVGPDGKILKRTVTSPSTDPQWDRAVLLAIDRAESLPLDDDGKMPFRQGRLTFKPKD
jgi:TonB family protein